MCFDFGGFTESEESLCFPKEGNFGTKRNLASFVGKADEAQPQLSSVQALAASLILKKKKSQSEICKYNQSINIASELSTLYVFISIVYKLSFYLMLFT